MNKFPFTATQWQELEHQALIFKYMVSGIPIPPDLLFTLRRNFLDPSDKLLISHHSQHVGWNCFQAGLGRKIDPEPGRCRRTDGKKWRCSKEAFPDSKYCERHMHRGKNRSRKPVEVSNKTQTGDTTSPTLLTNSLTPNLLHNTSTICHDNSPNNFTSHINIVDQNPTFVHHHHCQTSCCPRPSGDRDNNLNTTSSLVFDSDLRVNRYVYGVKEEVDEHAFFSEEPSRRASLRGFSNATSVDESWQLTPLTISCSSHSSSSSTSSTSKQLQSSQYYYPNNNKQLRDHNGGDNNNYNNSNNNAYLDGKGDHQTQKTIHHFFDEWPMKQKESWLDLDDKSSNSTTRLSISMPKASHDFPIFSSRR